MRKKIQCSLSTFLRLSLGFLIASQLAFTAYAGERGKRFSLSHGDYALHLNSLMQADYKYTINNAADNSVISIKKADVALSGHAVSKDFTYDLMFDLANANDTLLQDASVNFAFMKEIQLKVGQFRMPFSHQSFQSDDSRQFLTERAERKLGISIHGEVLDRGMLQYHLFASGRVLTSTDRTLGLRLNANLLGNTGYDIADIEGSKNFGLSLGAGFSVNKFDSFAGNFTADFLAHIHGFSLFGQISFSITSDTDIMPNLGFQVGYFLMPRELELALRMEQTRKANVPDENTLTAAINYHIHKNTLKFQAQYSHILDNTSHELALQVQLAI
jgi:hypothetical protein